MLEEEEEEEGGEKTLCVSAQSFAETELVRSAAHMCACVSMGHVFSALPPRLCVPFACGSQTLQQVHQTNSVPMRANRWRFAFSLTLTAAQKPRYDLSVRDL